MDKSKASPVLKDAWEFKLECVGKYKNGEYIDCYNNKRIKAKITIRVFKARFFDLAYKADYWQGQS